MPSFWYKYGANQSAKLFKIRGDTFSPDRKPSVLEQLSNRCVIREPRSFRDDRKGQTFRHLASVIKRLLDAKGVQGYQEIQVGLGSDGKSVIVSTNTNGGNSQLREIIAGGKDTVAKLSRSLTADPVNTGASGTSLSGHAVRLERHFRKFTNPERIKRAFGEAEVSITVPDDVPKDKNGLHAELRILKAGGTSPVGIKRPCAHCFTQVAPDANPSDETGPGPGPQWLSDAANRNNSSPSDAVTRITRTQAGELRVDHGSDSDSDDEGRVPAPISRTSVLQRRTRKRKRPRSSIESSPSRTSSFGDDQVESPPSATDAHIFSSGGGTSRVPSVLSGESPSRAPSALTSHSDEQSFADEEVGGEFEEEIVEALLF